MSNPEIERKAKRLKALKNQQENLQQEIDQLEEDLKSLLRQLGVEEAKAGPFRVIWRLVTSSRFDEERFSVENGTLYRLYQVPRHYRKFSIV